MSTNAIRLTLKEVASAIRLYFDPAARILRWVIERVHAGGSMASAVRAEEAELETALLREELAEQEIQNCDLQRALDRAKQEIVAMDTIVREDVEVLTHAKQALVDAQSDNELSAPTLLELMKSVSALPRTGVVQCAQATLTSHFADLGGANFVIVLWQACEHEGQLVLKCLHSCGPDYPLTPVLSSMKRVLPLSARLSTPETLLWHQLEIDRAVPDVEAETAQGSSFGLYADWPGSPLAACAIKSVYCIKIDDPVPTSPERKTAGILSVYADDPGFFGNDRNMAIVRPSIKLFVRILERECVRLWVNAKVQKDLQRLGGPWL